MPSERPSHVGLAWMGLALVSVVVVASDGAARLLLMGGLAVAGLGLVALMRGRVRWARLDRRSGALSVAAGLIAALVGGAMSGQATATIAAAPTPVAGQGSSTTSPSRSDITTTTRPDLVLPPKPSASDPSVSAPSASAPPASAALATLAVKGRAPKTGYDRALFGQAWADVDRNGCDTRNDVLRRDLTAYALKAGTHGCLVLSGTLHDPYTATTIAFVRGQATSAKVQIDHVVALSDAWQKGAQQWSTPRRTAYANDSLNLLAVDGLTNQRKSDGDAATWLPPDKAYRCPYAARQVAVKAKYGLWVTGAERDALARILAACPSQTLPTAAAFVLGGGSEQSGGSVAQTPAAAAQPIAPQLSAPKPPSSTDPRFATCKAAKAAGFGPYQTGQDPEYEWYRDADRDGIVCE
jgi:hypothetical protein